MPTKRRKKRTTFSIQIKKAGKFKSLPKLTAKQKKDVMLERGKFKKIPALYAVERKGGRVVKARKL